MAGAKAEHRGSMSGSLSKLGLFSLAAGLAVACGPEPTVSVRHTVVDSAGVTIVESIAPGWPEGEEWTIAAEPEVVIGEVEGDERYLLDDVHGMRRFPDGRIAILDRGSSLVRVYDPAGRHLIDVGGPGEGPSEFSRPQHLELVGNAIVRDVLFGATSYVASAADRLYLASSEVYSIQVLDEQGRLRRLIRRMTTPKAVAPDHIRRYVEQMVAAGAGDPENLEPWIARLADGPVAEVMPEFRLILTDASENLWVEDWDDVGVGQGGYSVFDPDGVWLGRVTMPPGLPWTRGRKPTMEIGEDYILGTWTTDFGVEQVRLYRIDKG